MGWSVELLGGVALASDSSLKAVGGTNQKVLVASLALRAGKVVSTERLIDLVWGEDSPDGARRTLQASVSKLRAGLGPDCPIDSDSGGYRLNVERSDVDALRYEDLAAQAFEVADVDPAVASPNLLALVETWEEPLAGLRVSDRMAAELAPLHELHGQVTERYCSTLIDSGDPATAVRLLEVLTRNSPTNEQSWLELSRGLVALGRRHDALVAVQRAREALRAELGVDLSPQLARFEVEILDGAASDAADFPLSVLRTDNLRPDPDGFVARTETDQLWAMLTPGTIVTLVGPGGIGKTRCVQAVGHRAVAEGTWSDGVWLVDLTTLSPDAPDIATAVSIAIGAGRLGSQATSRSVVDYLGGREVLLILDNCEHVRAAVRTFIAELFATRCSVAVLATSRIRLGVQAERVVALDPMSMSAACQLFNERVSEIGAGRFELESVEALCAALDCYPLAIELAAARTRTLSAREIVERLDRHPALASRRIGLDPDRAQDTLNQGARHASLDVALDWSLAQLAPHTRATLQRIAVFSSDFDLAAAESIVAIDGSSAADVVDDVGVLVEHHLVVRDHARERFKVLEPIRQTLLAHEGLSNEIRRHHGEYFVELAFQIGAGVFGPEEARWWDRFEHERTNLRDAIRWAADEGELGHVETAMSSMALLVLEGADVDPGEWAEDALSRSTAQLVDLPCTALTAAAGRALALRFDECDQALGVLDQHLTDPRLRAMMYFVKFYRNPGEAQRWVGSMLDAAIEADDPTLSALAKARGLRADAIACADEHGSAAIRTTTRVFTYATLPSADQPNSLYLVEDAYRLAMTSNNQMAIVQAALIRGTSLCRAGNVERGAPFLLESLEWALRRRLPQHVWSVIEAIANLLVVMNREPETSALLWAAVEATDIAPFTRVVRHAEHPRWVEARLSATELEHARATGRTLDMDEAAREARKTIERFADA